MILTCESNFWDDYLAESDEVDYRHDSIQEIATELFAASTDENDYVKRAFEFVRDEISHSWDIQSTRITRKASEVLLYKEGICYAKSNLLCAILRTKGIPVGFCYQRLTIGDTPDTGYCIHAMNAVFFKSHGAWKRLDARGNKAGIEAEFNLDEERLAFPVRQEYMEADYPVIYMDPNPNTMNTLKQHTDCLTMYLHGLPTHL
ncbi:transglutaminase-like domain-containing protein [Paenibacillus spongiae]|uniref:Transglutaminase family protein n=1 Tax=Paenibacillus spongiae TaxID=2909671 RepID=A0ABY5SKF9_9BACL|nr:transglutaminase family protein [Paenibacillus spongiae]UVI33160.1 transglutaminase family protein [Paenibacillus spongiae]